MRLSASPSSLIVISIFIDLTGYGVVLPLLSFYSAYFSASSTAFGLLLATSAVMQFIFAPMLGKISDVVGRKPILLLSIFFSMASFILFAIANSYSVLLLSRIMAGVASETAIAEAFMSDITGEKERTIGMGQIGAAYGVGFIVGPIISGLLSVYGFSAAGFAAAAITFLNFLFVLFFLHEPTRKTYRDLPESTISIAYLRRLKVTLSKPIIGATLGIYFITTVAFASIPVVLPLLAIKYYNFNSVEMSYAFIYLGVVQIVLQGFFIGKLAKRVNEENLIVFTPLLMILGVLLMPLIQYVPVFLISIAMIAVGSGIMLTIVPSFISKKVLKMSRERSWEQVNLFQI